ncbi:MAG TPA: type II toxin-antitoxin system VapC family toxin [Longimicrobium sp.]|nr:type II toxin-antitoxin system VapC family toxin [Longimicrobium sp.]
MRRRRHGLCFLDTSALAKIYLKEEGSRRLASWVGKRGQGFDPSVRVYVSRLGYPEAISAISKRHNVGEISRTVANRLLNEVSSDFSRPRSPFDIVELTEVIWGRAALLVAQHNLRASDAVQLASALHLHIRVPPGASLLFVSSDRKLNKAAQAERMTIGDPTA